VFGGGGNGDKIYHLAMNSYGQEMTECAAYFSIAADALKTRPEREFTLGAAEIENTATILVDRAFAVARRIEQQDAVVRARLDLNFRIMFRLQSNFYTYE
jgi:hypothetical protein